MNPDRRTLPATEGGAGTGGGEGGQEPGHGGRGAATTHPSPQQHGGPQNVVYSGLVVAVSLALFRSGPVNILLVVGTAALLLCNPWVRTLLELPSTDAAAKARSKFDPARYLLFTHGTRDDDAKEAAAEQDSLPSTQNDAALDGGAKQLSTTTIAPPLRKPVQRLVELVVRDFVKHWYDPITFAHPGFPKAADASISHMIASIYLRLGRLRNVDATSELLLTSQSVILASLRRKRKRLQAFGNPMPDPDEADSDLTWPNSSARIESLRKGIRRLLARNMTGSERQSPVVVSLMTEILTKQCWEAVQYVSDPDFINMQIVKWGEPASETSLHDKTLSPKELEAVKDAAQGTLAGVVDGRPNKALGAAAGEATKGLFAEQPELSPGDVGKLTPQDLADQPAAAPQQDPGHTLSSDPLSSLGGFATSALSSVTNAAGRTVDVVGEGLGEVGNTLLGAVGDDDAERSAIPPRNMRLDVPSALSDPPLPDSLKRSLRQVPGASGQTPTSTDAYTIPDTPDPAPAPTQRGPPLPMRPTASSPVKAAGQMDFPSLDQVLSGQAGSVYDAFEAFLEDARPPLCGPGEGESVLRLHTQLGTLSTIAQFEDLDARTLHADASNILTKALQRLPNDSDADGSRKSLRTALAQTLDRLRVEPSMATLEPLQHDLDDRLERLYRAFAEQTQGASRSRTTAAPAATQASSHSRDHSRTRSERSTDAESPSRPLAYEPRRKNSGPSLATGGGVAALTQPPSRPPSTPPRPSSIPSRSTSTPQPPPPRSGSTDGLDEGAERASPSAGTSQSDATNAAARGSAEVMVTDVSNNAGKAGPLDARSLELMIVVEGISSDGGHGDGFVLLRRWSEFEALDAELQRMPRSSNPPPRLPAAKGKSSAQFCPELEGYLRALLASSMMDHLASNPTMQRFMDKNRAGAPAEAVRERGGPAAFFGGIGKNIVSGVGAVGKTAKTGFGLQASAAVAASQAAGPTGTMPAPGAVARPTVEGVARGIATPAMASSGSPFLDSASSDASGFPSRTGSPSGQQRPASGPAAQMSAKDLDQILSAIFAVADEAFNLQGGWTLRRGMLRVLEQVVRTTYSGSVVSTFNEAASSLNRDSFATWTEALLDSYWPEGQWSTESWPERTAEERQKTAERAREIIVSYAPAQAGYVLGPGGRAACVEALAAVHESLTDPVTAADLGLTMTLKVLEMSSR
ncbi:uncharacterized protein PFL1_00994 [Pseudozyma flocculosa PF-1]|uniref:PXA domain-containing protein n=1 Tax=Pseudozyma flocculosa TaxID=84751 RepID=A0A5C3FAP9_9BASI|nr:uncharacterized protein PFL1_00994 [Pseudozyma flocculosa PF-1]EPQ31661.1 hypothetical protein PFL1_00994 [Pseudozyma flocculosa PF-1]SPO40777.1 uncharacterized protein PSFLO_06259 [Pseudozyma flocculosa]